MNCVPEDSVKTIAEQVGASGLRTETANFLAREVEYRLRELVQDAAKFMKHSHRTRLSVDDVHCALRCHGHEPVYGHFARTPRARFVQSHSVVGLFYHPDAEVPIADVINAELPRVPRDTSMAPHWLAVEGVQPLIPQNPLPGVEEIRERQQKRAKLSVGAQVTVVEPVAHILSKELQLYFERISAAVLSGRESHVSIALQSVSQDPGLHALVPYFTQFVADQVAHNLRSRPVLDALMRFSRAVIDNAMLSVGPYLHQLLPAILTCVVSRRLSDLPTEDHWSLRDYAAGLVAHICTKYGDAYASLQPRVSRIYLEAVLSDPPKPLPTQYGGIVGVTALGPHCVAALLLPSATAYMKQLQPQLPRFAISDNPRGEEARKCEHAFLEAVGSYLRHEAAVFRTTKGSRLGGYGGFGARAPSRADADRNGRDAGSAAPSDVEELTETLRKDNAHFPRLSELFGERLLRFLEPPGLPGASASDSADARASEPMDHSSTAPTTTDEDFFQREFAPAKPSGGGGGHAGGWGFGSPVSGTSALGGGSGFSSFGNGTPRTEVL